MSKSFLSSFSIILANLDAVHRLLIGLGFGAISYCILEWMGIRPVTRIMMAWDIFSLLMIIMMWIIFFNIPENKINLLAQREDASRPVIFSTVIVSVLVSLIGIVILIKNSSDQLVNKSLHEPVSLVSVGISWLLLHTTFTIHYAHLFYDDDDQRSGSSSEGIDFPGKTTPDYVDFAYFSFVVGMTFQVSDATISSRKIRRMVLLHSVLSFFFNTIIVALTISVISSK